MSDADVLRELASLVGELVRRGGLKMQVDRSNRLMYLTVVPSDRMQGVDDLVTELLGPAFKPAGTSAWWKNLFDPFVKMVGGIQRDQTLFRRVLTEDVSLYCAFWPWASDPARTSVRVSVACSRERRAALEREAGA